MQQETANRISYLDYLRVFAAFGVIMIHVSSQNWYTVEVRTAEWQIFNAYDSVVRWSVPVFVMISGAVFLGREWNFKTLFSRHIVRLAGAFLIWGLIYALFESRDIITVIRGTLSGHFHLWFLPMMIGLYLCIPVFQKIAASAEVTKYFLTISFLFFFALPQIRSLFEELRIETGAFRGIFSALAGTISQVKGSLIGGYAGYFIAGFYLSRAELSRKVRTVIYWLGAGGFLSTILLSAFYSLRRGTALEYYYDSYTVNVLLESVAVFVWFRYHADGWKKWDRIAARMAKYSFGAYLVHVLVRDQIDRLFGLNTLSFQPLFSVPVIGLLVFAVSFAISGLLSRIPRPKK